MPITVRIVAVTVLIMIYAVVVDPLEGDSLSLLFFYWLTKGAICLCAYLILGHSFERMFSTSTNRSMKVINLLVFQGLLMAISLTLIDLPLESLLPVKAEYVENPSVLSFIEETIIHWIALVPLSFVSILCDPVFNPLKQQLLTSRLLVNENLSADQNTYSASDLPVSDSSRFSPSLAAGIHRIEAAEHYVLVYYQDRKEMIKSSFGSFVGKLTNLNGLQVHRSHWVNLEQVLGMERNGRKLRVIMKNGDRLPVSNSFREIVLDNIPRDSVAYQ